MSWVISGSQKNKGLLDEFTGAAAAYSLRDLTFLRGGPVVRVRRSSDNTEADFTATQISNGSLASWVGSGNTGTVSIWYDQSGNGRNLTGFGLTPTQRYPSLVSSGTLVTENGKPILSFNGSSNVLETNKFQLSFPFSVIAVLKGNNATLGTGDRFGGHGNNGQLRFNAGNLSGFFGSTLAGPAASGQTRLLVSYYSSSSSSISLGVNNSALSANTSGPYLITSSRFSVGGFPTDAGAAFFNGLIQEFVVFSQDKSSDRAAIESNINTHYSIY
jgi:hypothetical protein